MSLDAMKQALEALELWSPASGHALNKRAEAVVALRAAIEQAQDPETELETYKRLYELRGKALERPCLNCGHQPAKIKAMAQPEQEPVAWMYVNTDGECEQIEYSKHCPITDDPSVTPLYTTPRQWQGLTDEELELLNDCGDTDSYQFARAIEVKLKEKNT